MEVIKTVQSFDTMELESPELIAYCDECSVAAVVTDEDELRKNALIRWHRDVDVNCGNTLELYSNNEDIRPLRGTINDGIKRIKED